MPLYHSDLHQPRWKRLVLWCLEDETGRAVSGMVVGLAIGWPLLIWGWWWAAVLAAFTIGIFAGRWSAGAPTP